MPSKAVVTFCNKWQQNAVTGKHFYKCDKAMITMHARIMHARIMHVPQVAGCLLVKSAGLEYFAKWNLMIICN